jgi:LPPG:FO 2-phospho-L-lactate transferase
MRRWRSVVVLSGGVGGARLVDGLARALEPDALSVVANTGDDFQHWGLWVCPDIDTIVYTLAGIAEPERGWGLAVESFSVLEQMRRLGQAGWFALGDRDLATHLARTEALARGETLTAVTARLAAALGVVTRILPMSDEPCPTLIDTKSEGTLSFQDWLVRRGGEPPVARVRSGARGRATREVLDALRGAELIVVGPSNPYVSIDPILGLVGVREALAGRAVVALSPIVAGRAIKGPLAGMIPDLGGEPASAGAIARHYGALLRGLIVERGDEAGVSGLPTLATATVMRSRDARLRLARELLAFAETLA